MSNNYQVLLTLFVTLFNEADKSVLIRLMQLVKKRKLTHREFKTELFWNHIIYGPIIISFALFNAKCRNPYGGAIGTVFAAVCGLCGAPYFLVVAIYYSRVI